MTHTERKIVQLFTYQDVHVIAIFKRGEQFAQQIQKLTNQNHKSNSSNFRLNLHLFVFQTENNNRKKIQQDVWVLCETKRNVYEMHRYAMSLIFFFPLFFAVVFSVHPFSMVNFYKFFCFYF